MKVVQILYSFLLVEKQFTLESSPSAPTKEKRFAYALYLDILVLIIKVARTVERRRGVYPLADTRFVSRLLLDDHIRSLMTRYSSQPFPLEKYVDQLAERISESGIYRTFLKDLDKEKAAADENVWSDILNHVVFTDPAFRRLISERENYTLKGEERAQGMINTTLVNFLASQDDVNEVVRALEMSLDKARELYFRLLLLPVELTDMQERVIDDNRHKFMKTEEDINPDMRFVDNTTVATLRENPIFRTYVEKNKLSWRQEDPVMMQRLLKAVTSSEIYRDYMDAPGCDRQADSELWRNLMRHVILGNEDFLESLEDKSVFWNDDLDIISTFALKTFRRLEDPENTEAVLDKYKDEEDARFGETLMRAVYRNKELYRGYIADALEGGNWDSERLAFMDFVIIETALAEILNFPKIPLTASINEYIEIAKSYSTRKSAQFVNGILGAIINNLRKDNKLFK